MVEQLKKIKDNHFDILKHFNYYWIAGGAIRDSLVGKVPYDIDIFFPSQVDQRKAKGALNKQNIPKIENFKKGAKYLYNNIKYDLLYTKKDPESCLAHFDFTICCAAIDSDNIFYYHENYFNHLENNKLVYTGYSHNLNWKCKCRRLKRFLNKGYKMSSENHALWLEKLEKDQESLIREETTNPVRHFNIKKKKIY